LTLVKTNQKINADDEEFSPALAFKALFGKSDYAYAGSFAFA
jgi:hypothetical protein